MNKNMEKQGKSVGKKQKNTEKTRQMGIIIAALLFGVLMFCATYFEWLAYPEQLTQDMMYQSKEFLNNDIKIIAIDDKSIEEMGNYNQWSRQTYADLLNVLYAGDNRPAVVAFDVLFFTERDAEGDAAFVESCKEAGNVVLASQLDFEQRDPLVIEENGETKVYWGGEELLPMDALQENTSHGFVNLILDNDGFVRHSLIQVETPDGISESFATGISRQYCEETGTPFIEPVLNDVGSILIHYVARPGSYESISIVDVLSGKVPASVFDDAIVLVGSYSEGMMDAYNVTVDRRSRMYGVEINANIVQTILSGEQIFKPALWTVALVNGLLAGFLLYITNNKRISVMSLVLLGALGVHFAFCFGLYHGAGILWYVTYMIVAIILIYIINVIWKYLYERREREKELKGLLYSMAEAMTEAIDQRTPYNGSHTRHVSVYCVELAEYVNAQYKKKRTKLHLKSQEINQLKLAALLHDVGKMSVPLEILDKPTRLGAHRNEIMTRLEKIELLYRLDQAEGYKPKEMVQKELEYIETVRDFVEEMDKKEFLPEEDKEKISELSREYYEYSDGVRLPFLTEEEIECLMIPKGTLTEEEMEQVHEHATYTDEILEHIQFGKDYSKVRQIAASHHELLNGQGYPRHLQGEEIDLATRILTICDVYDALTADDRPYKKAKTKEQTFMILDIMAKDGEIDSELAGFAKELWGELIQSEDKVQR